MTLASGDTFLSASLSDWLSLIAWFLGDSLSDSSWAAMSTPLLLVLGDTSSDSLSEVLSSLASFPEDLNPDDLFTESSLGADSATARN
jgi:hypothetical protein